MPKTKTQKTKTSTTISSSSATSTTTLAPPRETTTPALPAAASSTLAPIVLPINYIMSPAPIWSPWAMGVYPSPYYSYAPYMWAPAQNLAITTALGGLGWPAPITASTTTANSSSTTSNTVIAPTSMVAPTPAVSSNSTVVEPRPASPALASSSSSTVASPALPPSTTSSSAAMLSRLSNKRYETLYFLLWTHMVNGIKTPQLLTIEYGEKKYSFAMYYISNNPDKFYVNTRDFFEPTGRETTINLGILREILEVKEYDSIVINRVNHQELALDASGQERVTRIELLSSPERYKNNLDLYRSLERYTNNSDLYLTNSGLSLNDLLEHEHTLRDRLKTLDKKKIRAKITLTFVILLIEAYKSQFPAQSNNFALTLASLSRTPSTTASNSDTTPSVRPLRKRVQQKEEGKESDSNKIRKVTAPALESTFGLYSLNASKLIEQSHFLKISPEGKPTIISANNEPNAKRELFICVEEYLPGRKDYNHLRRLINTITHKKKENSLVFKIGKEHYLPLQGLLENKLTIKNTKTSSDIKNKLLELITAYEEFQSPFLASSCAAAPTAETNAMSLPSIVSTIAFFATSKASSSSSSSSSVNHSPS